MFASAQYNHWEDDDYNLYLSDLFWDDMLGGRARVEGH